MKKLLPFFSLILALPSVAANGTTSSGFVKVVSFVLGAVTTTNEALIKLALFAVLFSGLIKGFGRVMEGNHTASLVLSTLIAVVGIRLMPDAWMGSLGKLLWAAAVIIIPYMIVNLVVPRWTLLKLGLLAVTYFGVYLVVAGTNFWGFGFTTGVWEDFRFYYHVYKFQTIAVILSVIVYFTFRWARGKHFRR